MLSPIVSQLNTGSILALAYFDAHTNKKSQILIKQNLASEEGDEKLYKKALKKFQLSGFNSLYNYLIE